MNRTECFHELESIDMENYKEICQRLKDHGAKVLNDFCESTSLHGWNYLNCTSNMVLKVIWVIGILGMTGLATYLLMKNTDEFLKSDVITTIESSTAPLGVSF